ncbi:helix-turn-helix domain containing protein [Halobacillus sp. H74]|uniref:helix-turn-helix domain containing protein n=1 Tax=Halobacillus sp. H74 TaxID=3457436 RepID=UPI003FCE5379
MKSVYIALENKNLSFSLDEVEAFEHMWNSGSSIFQICKMLKRTKIEIAVLIMDRADKGKIKERPHGIFGVEGELV